MKSNKTEFMADHLICVDILTDDILAMQDGKSGYQIILSGSTIRRIMA